LIGSEPRTAAKGHMLLSMSYAGKAGGGLIGACEIIVFNRCNWGERIANDYDPETIVEGGAGDIGARILSAGNCLTRREQQDTREPTSEGWHEQIHSAYGMECCNDGVETLPCSAESKVCMKAAFL